MLKLQTLSVIFVLIIVPITILLSYYIDTQIDTIALQNSYDAKLLNATYDAIVSFELNTINNKYSTNAESLRRDITASVNTFNKSLANNFGISGAGKNAILPYVPALVYTLYDGYYIYSPIENTKIDEKGNATKVYEHTLKPYVYYTARYTSSNNTDFVINYSLDNYIVVYGYIGGEYYSEAGYLINGEKFKEYNFDDDDSARNYFVNAKSFTKRFYNRVKDKTYTVIANGRENEIINGNEIFNICEKNDPDDKLSPFVEHKSTIIKESIQSNLNSAIAHYNAKQYLGESYVFKMPIFDDTEWDKILSNVSIVALMQGLPVGLNTYNNYMIVTSTENKQCIDEHGIYFVAKSGEKEGQYYHRINCPLLQDELKADKTIEGFRSIDFDGIYTETENEDKSVTAVYKFNHTALACYHCIVQPRIGSFKYDKDNLIDFDGVTKKLRETYYTALFKERNNLIKVSSFVNGDTSAKFPK